MFYHCWKNLRIALFSFVSRSRQLAGRVPRGLNFNCEIFADVCNGVPVDALVKFNWVKSEGGNRVDFNEYLCNGVALFRRELCCSEKKWKRELFVRVHAKFR